MELAVSLGHTDAAWVLYDLVPRKIARESIQKLIERKIEEETMKMFGCRVESFDINAYEEGELEEEVCRAVEERGPWMNLLNIFPRGLDSLPQQSMRLLHQCRNHGSASGSSSLSRFANMCFGCWLVQTCYLVPQLSGDESLSAY
eukprot:745983-Hanusia_phi.AAC.2